MKKALILVPLLAFSLSYAKAAPARFPAHATFHSFIQPADSVPYVEASFKGGKQAWLTYLMKNIRYPTLAIIQKIQGRVLVDFDVSATGKVSNVQVIKSIDRLLDNEAMRLIKVSPDWIPATRDGKYVDSHKQQPITFKTPQ
jgi:TonB family protein